MGWIEQQTKLHTDNTRRSVPVYRDLSRSRTEQPYDYPKRNYHSKHNRYYKYLPAVVSLLFCVPANAESVGGVSATAAPIANSSGSVTNQAIQVLQGPYITNTYGGGIQCQGETVNVTPFITGNVSAQKPFEGWWDSPVYDMTTDEDGNLNNPGDILYYTPTRTGQKDNYNLSLGLSATWSKPRDKKLQDLCKEAASTQIKYQQQAIANKRLDFEIARLKNCGELLKSGIRFAPGTRYATICADVQVKGVNFMVPHVHPIPKVSSEYPSTSPSPAGSADDLLPQQTLPDNQASTSSKP